VVADVDQGDADAQPGERRRLDNHTELSPGAQFARRLTASLARSCLCTRPATDGRDASALTRRIASNHESSPSTLIGGRSLPIALVRHVQSFGGAGISAGISQQRPGIVIHLGRAFGGPAAPLAAAVALVVTLGTMNTFLASLAKLGAALGRDGALPSWLAHGSQAGEVPRRSLLAAGGIAAAGLTVTGLAGITARPAVLLATSCFVAVYAVAAAAGIRLLPPGPARAAAMTSLLLAAALAWTAGWYLAWPAVLAAGAICFTRRNAHQPGRHRTARRN
jgi:hypothetical protein